MPWPFCRLNLRSDPLDTTKSEVLAALYLSAEQALYCLRDGKNGDFLTSWVCSRTSPSCALLCSQHMSLSGLSLGHRITWLRLEHCLNLWLWHVCETPRRGSEARGNVGFTSTTASDCSHHTLQAGVAEHSLPLKHAFPMVKKEIICLSFYYLSPLKFWYHECFLDSRSYNITQAITSNSTQYPDIEPKKQTCPKGSHLQSWWSYFSPEMRDLKPVHWTTKPVCVLPWDMASVYL